MPAARTVVADLVSLDQISAAADRIEAVAVRTPLLQSRITLGSPPAESRVWLKCESLQHAGAFKLRGAYNLMSQLSADERARGVVTYSSGNHAQGVAWSARELSVAATVVMPVDAPAVKRDAVVAMGAEIEQVGTTTLERQARAEEIVAAGGGVMVPPFDDARIIAGQGTVGLEIIEDMRRGSREVGLVVIPIGGGGLISGVAAAFRNLSPGTRIVGVEPEGAPKMLTSLRAGHPVTLDRVDTIADGLKPVRPGDLTFAHVRDLVDEVVTVSDASIREAVLWCYRRRLVVEPSGAAGLAVLRAAKEIPGQGEIVVVLSGGNLDPQLLHQWMSAGRADG